MASHPGPTAKGHRLEVYPDREAIVEFDPATTFECVDECTWCCHHGVLLYEPDFFTLAGTANLSEALTTVRGEEFIRTIEPDRSTHVDEDGRACYFLDGDGKCALQLSADWKPTRCSVFPLHVERRGDELHVDIRDSATEHCEGLGVSDRRIVDHLDAFLPELLWELECPDTDHPV